MRIKKATVLLGLGSNIGHKMSNLTKAIDCLELIGIKVLLRSKIFQTPPWGFNATEDFYNMVVKAETYLEPFQLLVELKAIELKMGRPVKEGKSYQSRIIDIDIIDYNNELISYHDLQVPHPLIKERNFVLFPLRDVCPEYVHPETSETITSLIGAVESETIVVVNN